MNEQDPYELAAEAAKVLVEATGVEKHDVVLVLGSGWAAAADGLGDVVADLLKAPDRGEWSDGIGHRSQPVHRQAGRNPRHVRFCDTAIEESLRIIGFEVVEQAVPDIAGKKDETVVYLCKPGDLVGKSVSHDNPNSMKACANSLAFGIR